MNKAVSRSLFTLFLLTVAPVETFADSSHDFYYEPGRGSGYESEISQRVERSLRSGESLKIADWLRLSPSEERELTKIKLKIRNQNRQTSTLSLMDRGEVIQSAEVRSTYSDEVTFFLPSRVNLETLRLICHGEVIVEQLTAIVGVDQDYGRGEYEGRHLSQPRPEEIIQLHLNKVVRGGTRFQLSEMVEAMQSLTLQGVEIERVVLIGRAESRSRTSASAQVLMDGRPVSSHEMISSYSDKTPINLFGSQFVNRSLELMVQGDMVVDAILLKVGRVQRVSTQYDASVQVRQILERGQTLSLAPFTSRAQHNSSRVTIHVNSLERYGELQILSSWGQLVQTATLRPGLNRVEVILPHNLTLRDLSLRSWSRVMVEALQFEEENRRRRH